MNDEFDDNVADMLLSEEEHAEMHHIQHHFGEVEDENERAVLGWRATSIYVAAFKREIIRLRQLTSALDEKHTPTNCRCGHADENHQSITICSRCMEGQSREVILTGNVE
jgi:hypothetical protein